MMLRIGAATALGLLLGIVAAADPPGAASTPASQPARQVRWKDLTVDLKARTVAIEAQVVQANYLLEFLLCHEGTKEYESVLSTKARPWEIHAALLMLGLRPGKPVEWRDGTYVPPRGAELDVSLEWKDSAGQTHSAAAGDWLASSREGVRVERPKAWVFVGSDVFPDGSYEADLNGGIIAVANVSSAVIDVPISSTRTLEARAYQVDPKAVPPVGTKVRVILRPRKGARRADHARALLEIDRNGQMTLGGEAVTMDSLTQWAEKFSERHKHGRVVIRSDAETPAGYAPQAELELKVGGVFEFEHRTASSALPLPPRTPVQLQEAMNSWQQRFAEPQEQIDDPADQAQAVLRQIQAKREEAKRLDALWADYERALRKELDSYQRRRSADRPKNESRE
jgi:hypothetical protein